MFPSGMEKVTLTFPKSDYVVNSHCTTRSNSTQGWGPSAERYSACLVHVSLSSIPTMTVKCNEFTGIKQQSLFTKCYQLDTSFLSVAHASFLLLNEVTRLLSQFTLDSGCSSYSFGDTSFQLLNSSYPKNYSGAT